MNMLTNYIIEALVSTIILNFTFYINENVNSTDSTIESSNNIIINNPNYWLELLVRTSN